MSELNYAYAVFDGNCNFTVTNRLWQWSYGQKLSISGIELPSTFEVQFCNKGGVNTITQIYSDGAVNIPDELLENSEWIEAFIFLHNTANDGETVYKISIPVTARPEPSNVEPTPVQQDVITETIAALNDAVESIPTTIDTALAEAKASGEFDGTDGADGSNAWTIDAENTRVVGNYIQCPLAYLVGPAGATVKPGDIVFISDGRFAQVDRLFGVRADTTLIGDLRGAPGADGQDGADGYSPEVTITEITGGHRVTITDEDHPSGQSFDVMDGQGGSGGDLVEVTYTQSGSAVACDHTYAEIVSALSAPHPVVVYGAVQGLGVVAATCNTSMVDGTGAITSVLVTGPGDYMVIRHQSSGSITITTYEYSPIPAVSQDSTQPPTSGAVYDALADKYELPSGGIPATDLASAVQTSLGKADTALQSAPVTSVNGQTGAVSLSIPTTASDVGAVAVAQGVAHAGEFVVVGSDGNITTVTMTAWQGGNY